MNISLGIVGLPNVGKSTLFNALTKSSIPAENYPFCTIDPNVGVVPVSDSRLDQISEIINPQKTVPAVVEFYDIAGLVRGAHKGEGLGNAFLANIRSTQAIVHVIRSFESKDITHVDNKIDPSSDRETIETELILKDMDTIEKQELKLRKELRTSKAAEKKAELLINLKEALGDGKLAITVSNDKLDNDIVEFRKSLFLLTDKKVIYLVNGDWFEVDDDLTDRLREELDIDPQFLVLPINVKQEYEISQLEDNEKEEFKKELGIEFSGLEQLTRMSYQLLDLISFFTAGEQEVKAWTIKKGSTAPQAAGAIHTDFQEKFITAEVVSNDDFINNNGWLGSKEAGKMRLEGKGYITKDGDVMMFRHGA